MLYGIPELYENKVYGKTNLIYHDIKNTLKVPIVNFIFRTLAWYDQFLSEAWNQIALNMLTCYTEEKSKELENINLKLIIPTIDWTLYYQEEEIILLKKIIDVFNYVNPKLLIIASAWAESLSNRPILGKQEKPSFIQPGIKNEFPTIHLVDMNCMTSSLFLLIQDIIKTHHAFDAASDFRALANFPDFLHISWQYLKPYVGSEQYTIQSQQLITKSIEIAHDLPLPVTISPQSLSQYYHPKEIAGIMGLVSLFQNFLPGLIIDGQFFINILR